MGWLCNEYGATVNWNGATPGSVNFYANDQLVGTVTGAGPDYTCEVNVGTSFVPSLRVAANTLRVAARSTGGVGSDTLVKQILVIPLPNATLQLLPWFQLYTSDQEVQAAVDFL